MNRIRDEQVRRNQISRDAWERFRGHRDRVSDLIVSAVDSPARLIVFGAGNANDLDLDRLVERFSRTTLIDLDRVAMDEGIARQFSAPPDPLAVLERDVGGLVAPLETIAAEDSTGDDYWDQVLEAAIRGPETTDWGSAEVVVSACLLTQLIEAVALVLDTADSRFLRVAQAIRGRHLRLLMDATAPSGTCLLITDVVSSETCPELNTVSDQEFSEVVGSAIQSRNFFTGANPFVIAEQFQRDPAVAPLVESVDVSRPWKWDLGPRCYAVCAIRARRRPAEAATGD